MIKDFLSQNFHYDVDLDYDTEYDCHNGSDCCDNDYCRCGRIVNAKVKHVKFSNIYEDIQTLNMSELERYGLERILSHYKYYDKDSWDIEVRGGYYGQEIGRVTLAIADSVMKTYEKFMKLDPNKQVEFLLELEYGYLLDRVKNKTWEIKKLNKNDLNTNRDYYAKIENVERYKNYPFILGIVVEGGLIDGYHRVLGMSDQGNFLVGS